MTPAQVLLLFNIISLIIVAGIMAVCKITIKKQSTKDLILKIVALLVVVIHYSSLYVDFFTNGGDAMVENNMILPVYPCNIIMWLLVVVAFMKNKESFAFKSTAGYTFIGGTLCGLIGVFFNTNFLNTPDLHDYDILKGLVSHWVMVFGTVYIFVFKYIKLRVVETTKSIFLGLILFVLCGALINGLYAIFDVPSVNAMYMLEPPLASLPFFNFFTMGLLGLILSFIGLNIYEFFALPKDERWINHYLHKRRK